MGRLAAAHLVVILLVGCSPATEPSADHAGRSSIRMPDGLLAVSGTVSHGHASADATDGRVSPQSEKKDGQPLPLQGDIRDVGQDEKAVKFAALTDACSMGNLRRVRELLRAGVDPVGAGESSNAPMYEAIANNHADILEVLVRAGANPDWDWGPKSGTPLTNAAQFGHIEVVRRLVDLGADVNLKRVSGFSALYRAIICNQRETAAYLRQKGAVLTDRDRKALLKLGIPEK